MGRGRQKAKQTKVARELKYSSSAIDVTALQRELSSAPVSPSTPSKAVEDDPYADRYGDSYSEPSRAYDDDEDDGTAGRYASAGY